MTATVEHLDFDAQMAIWDAAYSGDVAEWTACMSEHPERNASFAGMAWFDGTAHDLASIQLWSGTERRDPPLWWALPGVVESQLWTPSGPGTPRPASHATTNAAPMNAAGATPPR